MCIALAIVGAGVIGAAATAYAGNQAADATTAASNAAIAEQNTALGQEESLTAPYRAFGQAALPQAEALLGLTGPTGAPTAGRGLGTPAGAGTPGSIQAALAAMPGYQFTKQQGDLGVANVASTQGGVSGNTLTALDTFNAGLADQTYQQAIGDVMGAVQVGGNAASQTASNVANTAGNISNIEVNQGQNLANIDIGTARGISGAVSGVAGGLLQNEQLQNEQQILAALAA